MKLKRILRKVLLISLTVVMVSVGIISALLYYYQDEIIQRFITEANKYLNTPVHIKDVSISILDSFPTLTLTFDQIRIEGSDNEHPNTLLEAEALKLTLNPLQIAQGNYSIEGIKLTNGECLMTVSQDGTNNYEIIKSQKEGGKTIAFELKSVVLDNILYQYKSATESVVLKMKSEYTHANISFNADQYRIATKGTYLIDTIATRGQLYVTHKSAEIKTMLAYEHAQKKITIDAADLLVEGSAFNVFGEYQFDTSRSIDLSLEGQQTTLTTIASLLPAHISKKLKDYESEGEAYFNLSLNGDLDAQTSFAIDFGLNKATIKHKRNGAELTQVTTQGYYSATDIYHLNKSQLSLKSIQGKIDGYDFLGEFIIKDFASPHIQFRFDGDMDLQSIQKFYRPVDSLIMEGTLRADFSFEGKLSNLKSKNVAQKILTSGQLELKDVEIKSRQLKFPLRKLNGSLLFNNNNVALEKVSGFYGSSDFELNGFFKNLWAYLLLPEEPIGIEASVTSKLVNLDELLTNKTSSNEDYQLTVSPRLMIKFKCNMEKLLFRRFKPENIQGNLLVKEQVIYSEGISFTNMGGSVNISGTVDASIPNRIVSESSIEVQKVKADSIFYVFEDFRQDFLKSQHLKGSVDAAISLSFEMDSLLNLRYESLESSLNAKIANGELNNFEPIQQLSKYLDENELSHLTFSDLQSDILVKDKTIYLPELEVKTNVTSLKIAGTHTFDQHINYRIVTPLRPKKKIDKDEAFGAIEENNEGRSLLYLKITGTTSDYQVGYDTDQVKKKIVSDIKKEVQELKDAFKNKGLDKSKTVELSEGDYFDWEEEDIDNN